MLHDAKFEATGKNIAINYEGVENIEMNGDPGMLRSAIENVVRNAIFYTGQGGKIEVKLGTMATGAFITVQDNGPGVPEDRLKLIFEPFYRVDDARGSTTGGMGLGLALADNAMRAHEGGIMARNLDPHGLEVTLMMPRLLSAEGSVDANARRVMQAASKPR